MSRPFKGTGKNHTTPIDEFTSADEKKLCRRGDDADVDVERHMQAALARD